MKNFNKKQKEIIAYFLALNVEEIYNKETKNETIEILAKLQKEGVYGHIEV